MTPKDQKWIWDELEPYANEGPMVVIHGTDQMVETALVGFERGAEEWGYPIIFTGSMVPGSVQGSDVHFNLGRAVGFAKDSQGWNMDCHGGKTF